MYGKPPDPRVLEVLREQAEERDRMLRGDQPGGGMN